MMKAQLKHLRFSLVPDFYRYFIQKGAFASSPTGPLFSPSELLTDHQVYFDISQFLQTSEQNLTSVTGCRFWQIDRAMGGDLAPSLGDERKLFREPNNF